MWRWRCQVSQRPRGSRWCLRRSGGRRGGGGCGGSGGRLSVRGAIRRSWGPVPEVRGCFRTGVRTRRRPLVSRPPPGTPRTSSRSFSGGSQRRNQPWGAGPTATYGRRTSSPTTAGAHVSAPVPRRRSRPSSACTRPSSSSTPPLGLTVKRRGGGSGLRHADLRSDWRPRCQR